jgi:hypothetical protein
MLTAIKEQVEVLPGGILQLHTNDFPEHSVVNVQAVIETPGNYKLYPSSLIKSTAGILQVAADPVKIQRAMRSEWDERSCEL